MSRDRKKQLPQLPDFDFEAFQKEALRQLKAGKPITGRDGVLTPLIKRIIENALKGELDAHLDVEPEEGKNRKNGKTSKTVRSDHGSFELDTPRDRNSTFEPELVKKRQTSLGKSLDDKIKALYGLGMSYTDIAQHMQDMYGIELSPATLSAVTDNIVPIIREWQARPLEEVYPFVWMDAIHYKVRDDGKIVSRAVYTILGLNVGGIKDVLGIYISEAEGANF
jgi:putative transposase